MLTNILNWTNGKKTYIFSLLWVIYKMAVVHNWIQTNGDLETILLGGGALSLRDAIAKLKA